MLIAIAALLLLAGQAYADQVLFKDSFQNPSTDLTPFVPVVGPFPFGGGPTGSQAILADPLGDGQNGLTFGATTFQGDIVTAASFSSASGKYSLTFDYLGTCGFSSGCGVIVGAPTSQNTTSGWLVGDVNFPYVDPTYGPLVQLTDNGQWQTVTIDFSSSVPVYIAIEDFEFAGHSSSQSAWYKDLTLTAVPEPGTLTLLGLGLFGFGFTRRRKIA
jgi:hypothetical protein